MSKGWRIFWKTVLFFVLGAFLNIFGLIAWLIIFFLWKGDDKKTKDNENFFKEKLRYEYAKKQMEQNSSDGNIIPDMPQFEEEINQKYQKEKKKKIIIWTVIGAVVLSAIVSNYLDLKNSRESSQSAQENREEYESNIQESPIPTEKSYYEGESGINAFASQSEDMIGDPQITINIKNVSDKNISAVTFYCFFYNVYGEEIKSNLLLKNGIYTDDTIKVGASDKCTWVFYEKSIKTIKVYLKHVYFEDGTSYGTRDYMSDTDIVNICPEIPVS